jgi:hypothetical protein
MLSCCVERDAQRCKVLELPGFDADGLLPPGDYEMSLEELQSSMLIEGPGEGYPNWDPEWRLWLVGNLRIMVEQLREVGIEEIFVNGSFVAKWQLPMWHRYRVELYPHYVDLPIALQRTGIRDEFGNDLHFPAAFRKSRREHKPKGIVKIRH